MCWGLDEDGQVSDLVPTATFLHISAGGDHTCGILDADSRIDCWGNEFNDQLNAPNDAGVVQITSGEKHSCAIMSGGPMDCWGDNIVGQTQPAWDPGPYSQLNSHYDTTCAVEADTVPHCWGSDLADQVTNMPSVQMNRMAAGRNHSCGIRVDDGRIECWGSDSDGQSSPPP
jgi:alpha-tubulin suppressor-like RCC1 family protein